jgi:hypothetical protein
MVGALVPLEICPLIHFQDHRTSPSSKSTTEVTSAMVTSGLAKGEERTPRGSVAHPESYACLSREVVPWARLRPLKCLIS